MSKKDTKIVKDGWGNLLAGFNSKKNKANLKYAPEINDIPDDVLDNIWENDGFSRRMISCVAEDMVNKGFSIIGDAANEIIHECDGLNWTGVFFDALCKARLHGGSAILMGINDGRSLDKPVALNSIKSMDFLRVYPKSKLVPIYNTIDTDPMSKYYGMPTQFEVSDGITPNSYKIHRDRLLLLPWVETSPIRCTSVGVTNRIWGRSVMSYTSKQISNLSVFHDSLSNLVQEAVIGKYKVANLTQMLANGEEEKVMTRMDIINEAKSVINAVLMDADGNEDYSRDSLSFAGMNGVADTMMVLLACVAEIPVTRLFGRSPSGLDASGESDLKIYYDMVSSYQKSMLTSAIQRLVFYIDRYKKVIRIEPVTSIAKTIRNGGNTGVVRRARPSTVGDIKIKWNPLYQMTEKEMAEVYFTNSEADKMYLDMGVLSAEEIRINRFLGGYNQHISVETADIPEPETKPETEETEKPESTEQTENQEQT